MEVTNLVQVQNFLVALFRPIIQEAINESMQDIDRKTPPQQADQWFDLNELCSYLPDKPATATVYGWVHTAQIPCHKGGKKLRFLKSEIDTWLMQGRKKTLQQTKLDADAYLAAKRKGGVNHG